MKNRFFHIFILAIAPGFSVVSQAESGATVIPNRVRQEELIYMVREDCGSCHGLTLKGGLGPALLPEALQGKDAQSLQLIIQNGIAGTPMPPWGKFLSEAEAAWIVEKLLQGFPDAH